MGWNFQRFNRAKNESNNAAYSGKCRIRRFVMILQNIKTLLEIDVDEEIFDSQLLLYINAGLRYLKNNGVPVSKISLKTQSFRGLKSGDQDIVLSWLHLYCLQRLDRTLMYSTTGSTATINWIDEEMTDLIYHLKARYDK
jgi:hypothetical protein